MPKIQTVAGDIVFILARHHTGHTTAAARNVEGKSDLHILLTPKNQSRKHPPSPAHQRWAGYGAAGEN
jgi:hypothetical protein